MSERLYRLGQGQAAFETGTAAGQQVLLGHTVHDVVLHWFDGDGRFLGLERVGMDVLPGTFPGTTIYRTDAAYWDRARSAVGAVKERIGFAPADILVRAFESDEAAIADLPGLYEEFLESPESFDDEARESLPGAIRAWRDEGRFVLSWYEDYWISESGEVISG